MVPVRKKSYYLPYPPVASISAYLPQRSTGWVKKLSDTITILRITAIAPKPTTVSVCAERRQVRSNM